MAEEVSFLVSGVEVRADLYLPPDLKPGERRPAIVAGHGFAFVKEGLVPQGEFFSAVGYIVLALDYRSFGRSGGDVRGELFPERQMEDFSAGLSYLQTRPEVEADRIAFWGTSFGGALVLGAGARDRRARAVVAQVRSSTAPAGCNGCVPRNSGKHCSTRLTRTAPVASRAGPAPAFRSRGTSTAAS